jgi:hypothetical protein
MGMGEVEAFLTFLLDVAAQASWWKTTGETDSIYYYNNVIYFLLLLAGGWERFSEFRFLVEPSDALVVRNRPTILDCAASSLDGSYVRPTIRWKRDGQFLQFPDFNDRR